MRAIHTIGGAKSACCDLSIRIVVERRPERIDAGKVGDVME